MNKLPIVGCMRWGIWGANFNTPDYERMIKQCLEIGLNSFDHADIYGNYTTEAEFGTVLKGNSALRNSIKIITKTGILMKVANRPTHQIKSYNTSKEHIIQSVDQSLKNFNTDYIDELLIHRPDVLLNFFELGECIKQLIKSGKIRKFGVSNFNVQKISTLHNLIPIQSHQIQINTLETASFTNGDLDIAFKENIEIQAWSPINPSLFTIKNEKNSNILKIVDELATQYNCSINQMLLAFLYKHPIKIIPVIGTSQFSRLQEATLSTQINLSNEDFYKIYSVCIGKNVD